jgi:hypothetical protein
MNEGKVDSRMKKKEKLKGPRVSEDIGTDIPEEYQDLFAEIVGLTNAFCERYLDEDYRELCEEMAEEVCLEELPSERARPASWASGIVHALGWVNCLQDPALSPHMTSAQVAEGFGVSQGTMTAKSRIIRDELDIIPLDPDWCTPAMLVDNPLVWTVDVGGFLMDARYAPRAIQEEAYRKGLIPFIPADVRRVEPQADAGTKILKFPSGQNESSRQKSAQQVRDDEPSLFEGFEE